MGNHHKDNLEWARENGYQFHAETQGAFSEGARDLDVFRKADGFRDHVLGNFRNRSFEIFDVRKMVREADRYGHVWNTVLVIPAAGLDLPDFDLLPRRETGGMNFLGIKGLDLKLDAGASPEERRTVDAFNKNYSLFGGGAFEAMEAAIKSAPHLVPSLSEVASVCKPGVLGFLANVSAASSGCIEFQNGYLAVRSPTERRIISGVFSDSILQGSERESLLVFANDLLDVLAKAASEAPLRALTLENTFRPAQLLGSVIGGVIGFCLGGFIGVVLLFLLSEKRLYLIPALALGGAALGRFIGNTLTRAR